MKIINNKIYFDNITASSLAQQFGTPLYVIEENIIREQYKKLKDNIPYPKLNIHYAMKANSNINLLRIIESEGGYIDATSPGEVFLALQAGFTNDRILFTGNNVSDDDMKYLIENNILINMDSISQLKRYGKMKPNSDIGIRINPDITAGTHQTLSTGSFESKFGIPYIYIDEILSEAKKYNLRIIGLHMHIGSGIFDIDSYFKGLDILLNIANELPDLSYIDIGGGIGITYKSDEEPFRLKEFGETISERLEKWTSCYYNVGVCKKKDITLKIEPGRFLVADSGTLLVRVNTIKKTPKKIFIGTDSGFNHFIRILLLNEYHDFIVDGKVGFPESEKVTICGNLCNSGDIFAKDRQMPVIDEGDLIAITKTGAYGFVHSSNFTARLKPAEVMITNGKARLIRKREEFSDLLRNQII